MNEFELILREKLEDLRDEGYAEFNSRGLPGVARERILGVRVPEIRQVTQEMLRLVFGKTKWSRGEAEELAQAAETLDEGSDSKRGRELTQAKSNGFNAKLYHEMNNFLENLPHKYLEYEFIHEGIVSAMTDFRECLGEVNKYLPYVDNWASCDGFSPKVFKDYLDILPLEIYNWLVDERAYTVRYGIVMMMRYMLDGEMFGKSTVEWTEMVINRTESVAEWSEKVREDRVESEINWSEAEIYYVRMAETWFLATALAKQWEGTIELFTEEGRLPKWVKNKAIQKAKESYRISPEQKEFLVGLKA